MATGNEDVTIVREFILEVGISNKTVNDAIWAEIRGYIRGRVNL